jgi:hypothetical protein
MAPRRRLVAVVSAAAAAIVAATVIFSDGDAASVVIAPGAVRLEIGGRPDSRPVAPGFIGLSIEYPTLLAYSGYNPAGLNPTFLALVRTLTPGQRPVLRFGGDTTDWTWWPTPSVAKPRGIRYTLGPRWLAVARATARALDARFIAGVNFEADRRTIAATEANALVRGIGGRYLAGLELGNEPEVYGSLGWYSTPTGGPVPGRQASYDFAHFLPDYESVAAVLPRAVPLVGPASGAAPWISGLGRFLVANPRVQIATFHRYPLHRCFTPRSSPDYPTIANLLAPVAASGPASSLQSAVAVAHARGVSFRVDELNSVSCAGKRGVSDTFASALWSLDTLFQSVRAGVDGVNIHTFKTAVYEPFAFSRSAGRWHAQVKPLYYGLLTFARAAPPGSRLLPTFSPPRPDLRVWATRSPDGTVRLLLINVSARRALTVTPRAPGPVGTASLQRLRAPRMSARGGVTLGGQSYGASTTTGRLGGLPRSVSLASVGGRYVIRVGPASAALLTLTRP